MSKHDIPVFVVLMDGTYVKGRITEWQKFTANDGDVERYEATITLVPVTDKTYYLTEND